MLFLFLSGGFGVGVVCCGYLFVDGVGNGMI